MLEVETPADMDGHVGEVLGVSEWVAVTQAMIDTFAEATGDHQWIHVDTARAEREMPGGKTIAHGYLTLSLLPRLAQDIFLIRRRSRGVNYGLNRVRFTGPVPAGARIRLRSRLKASDPMPGGRRLTFEATVEIEGAARPALVAETMALYFE